MTFETPQNDSPSSFKERASKPAGSTKAAPLSRAVLINTESTRVRTVGKAAPGKAVTGKAVTGKAVTGKAVTGKAVTGKAAPVKTGLGKAVTGKAVEAPRVGASTAQVASAFVPRSLALDLQGLNLQGASHVGPKVLWKQVGDTAPRVGRELTNAKLSFALRRGTKFLAADLAAFAIDELQPTDFIKSGTSYFQLAGAAASSPDRTQWRAASRCRWGATLDTKADVDEANADTTTGEREGTGHDRTQAQPDSFTDPWLSRWWMLSA